MKKNLLQSLLIGVASSTLLSGCVYSHHAAMQTPTVLEPTGRVIVTEEAPPMPRHEVVGIPPTSGSVWISGYWTRGEHQWVWVPGHWETPPATEHVWMPGHWDRNTAGRGWIWTPGHWE